MRKAHYNLPHWNYYRLLEHDLENCFRYVQPCKEHFDVYSDEFARIILMSSTEIENALKSFALEIKYSPPPKSIFSYFKCVTSVYPRFCEIEIEMARFSLIFKPWDGWSETKAPDWWTYGYNKIKHDKLKHISAPTMIRAIKSLSALEALLLHYYRKLYPDFLMPAEILPQLMEPFDPKQGSSILCSFRLTDDP